MLVVMAGLPGTGKSTLAAAVAARVGGVVLSKDEIRHAAFPGETLDYSAGQDDLAMEMLYSAAAYIHAQRPAGAIFVDGRTFSRRRQVERVLAFAAGIGAGTRFVECVCDEALVRERLASSFGSGHRAGNRTFKLYLEVRARAEPLEVPRLTLDTGRLSVAEAVAQCLEYLGVRLATG